LFPFVSYVSNIVAFLCKLYFALGCIFDIRCIFGKSSWRCYEVAVNRGHVQIWRWAVKKYVWSRC